MAAKRPHTNGTVDHGVRNDADSTWGWIIAVVAVLTLSVMAAIFWNQSLLVQSVEFSGYHFVEPEQLRSRVELPENASPDSIKFMQLIQRIEQVPYVERASANVQPSGKLLINIRERTPIALLVNGNQKRYVDADGIKLPVILGKAVDVPVLYGFDARMNDTLKSTGFKKVSDFLQNTKTNSFADATISEVTYTEEEGVIALSHENGVKLLFGKESFSDRLQYWKAFYGQVIRKKGINRMRQIDFRFKDQIITKES